LAREDYGRVNTYVYTCVTANKLPIWGNSVGFPSPPFSKLLSYVWGCVKSPN
jgi:hypothetical protein